MLVKVKPNMSYVSVIFLPFSWFRFPLLLPTDGYGMAGIWAHWYLIMKTSIDLQLPITDTYSVLFCSNATPLRFTPPHCYFIVEP